MLTQQYKLTLGQSGETYYWFWDGLIEIPNDIPPDAIEVKIYSNQITTVKANVFLQLSLCARLHVGTNISEIEPGAFNGLTALTHLSLVDNKLDKLYVNIFSGIRSCKELYLRGNRDKRD